MASGCQHFAGALSSLPTGLQFFFNLVSLYIKWIEQVQKHRKQSERVRGLVERYCWNPNFGEKEGSKERLEWMDTSNRIIGNVGDTQNFGLWPGFAFLVLVVLAALEPLVPSTPPMVREQWPNLMVDQDCVKPRVSLQGISLDNLIFLFLWNQYNAWH